MDDLPTLPGYRITERIGEGGMATVYGAVQLGLDRPVAVKFMAPELTQDEKFGKRFLREARIVGQLSHAHIVPVYDVGEQDGHFFLSMERLNGGDLRDAMSGGLSEGEKRTFLQQISQALRYAHKRGFVHRDIKPDNVLLRDAETVVVTDFGIAREIASEGEMTEITAVQSIIGSPKYMSPEQTRGEVLDARTDLYSLGVLAWLLLTGEPPHDGDTIVEIAINRNEEPVPELPARLAHWQTLLGGLLAYDREDRFPDCDAVLAQLAKLERAQSATAIGNSATADEATAIYSADSRALPVDDPEKTSIYIPADTSADSEQSQQTQSRNYWWLLIGLGASFAISTIFYRWQQPAEKFESLTPPAIEKNDLSSRQIPPPTLTTPTLNKPTTTTPTVSLLTPKPTEYFAFRDTLGDPQHSPDPADVDRFLKRFPNGVLADVIRVRAGAGQNYIDALHERAERGDPVSQLALSELYSNGWGVKKDSARAREFAAAAASKDRPFATYHLATLLLAETPNTTTVSKSTTRLLEESAAAGFYLAQTLLGRLAFNGRLTGSADIDKSLTLFEQAAKQGDRNAMTNLGQILDGGLGGIAPDRSRALKYFEQAAALERSDVKD